MTRLLLSTLLIFGSLLASADIPFISISLQQFWDPERGPYIELYYYTETATLTPQPTEGGYQSGLEVHTLLLDGEYIKAFDKLTLMSEVVADTNLNYSLIGLSRIPIAEGSWPIKVVIRDAVDTTRSFEILDTIDVVAPHKTSLSQLMLTELEAPSEDWIRHGVPYYPRSLGEMTYYPNEDSLIQLYTEVYQPETPERLMVRFSINDLSRGGEVEGFTGAKMLNAAPASPIAQIIDISELPTGMYYVKLEIINNRNQILGRDSISFGRRNDKMNSPLLDVSNSVATASFAEGYSGVEDWRFLVDCVFPIADQIERLQSSQLVSDGDTVLLKRFLTSFWMKRDPTNPKAEFEQYMARVNEMNRMYGGGTRRGYQTDMGRVRLQYGEPTQVENRLFDNETYPYQVWQYDQLSSPNRATQTNKVFIFVNRQVAGNQYDLIHSNAYGEIYDPQWIYRVTRNGGRGNNPDIRSSDFNEDPFGSRLNNNSIINSGTSNGINRR